MALELVLGQSLPVETNQIVERAEKIGVTVVLEGRYSDLQNVVPASYSPGGNFTFENSRLSANGDGTGTMEIKFHDSGNDELSATRTTYRVDMAEVSYELQDHPDLKGAETQKEIAAWLATEPAKRVDDKGAYQYEDADGQIQPVGDAGALKFCAAFDDGIKNFLRFYPVIERITYWKRPPGMFVSAASGSMSGSPSFSAAGGWSTPPITLNGYSDSNYFKSKDSWTQGADQKWTRVEQWTWTPDGPNGSHGWIYGGSGS